MHCPFIVYSVPVSMESIYHVTILCWYYCSVAKSCPTLCNPMNCSTASFSVLEEFGLFCPISQSLLKFMSIESVMLSNYLIICCPLLLLPSIFPSTGVFSNESVLPFRWPKYWSFSFSISPSSEYLGLISLRMDWFDFLAVQGTVKSLLQLHSSKSSILSHSHSHSHFTFYDPTLKTVHD